MIFGEIVLAMFRNPHVPFCGETFNRLEGPAHLR